MRYKREGDCGCGCGFANGAGVKSDDILAGMDMGNRNSDNTRENKRNIQAGEYLSIYVEPYSIVTTVSLMIVRRIKLLGG